MLDDCPATLTCTLLASALNIWLRDFARRDCWGYVPRSGVCILEGGLDGDARNGAMYCLIWSYRDSRRANRDRNRELAADWPPGPNGHWSRDVRAERNHLSEREVLTPGPRWPDVVQARREKQEGHGRPLQGHPTG